MLRTSPLARLGWFVVLALCFLLTGCGKNKVTKANFDKIKNDMSLSEVQEILGEGEKISGESNVGVGAGVDVTGGSGSSPPVYKWENGDKSITVTFNKQGKVVGMTSKGL
jgi:hypothetical protein